MIWINNKNNKLTVLFCHMSCESFDKVSIKKIQMNYILKFRNNKKVKIDNDIFFLVWNHRSSVSNIN